MLCELRVRQLGVIDDVTVVLGPGLTALTGETGAGKTLLVDAIELLLGGTTDTDLVRPGASEATVEGRFVGPDGQEVILARVLPAGGRSRAYLDGRMVAASQLAEIGAGLVDLHGQHSHQSLMAPAAQRSGLDRAAGLSTAEVDAARRRVREIRQDRGALGGDPRSRTRELDLLRYQLEEMDAAHLDDPDEDDALRDEEDRLADASGLRDAATAVWQGLAGEDGLVEGLGNLVAAASGRRPLAEMHRRLLGVEADLSDLVADARDLAESSEDNPQRQAEVGSRRQVLTELRRKYGDTLAEVMAFREEVRAQVEDLDSRDTRAAALDRELAAAEAETQAAERRLWAARREAGPRLASQIEARLRELAMPRARFEVAVGDEPGSESVVWRLGANPGEPVLPLAKVASGGELARTMLAARLSLGPASTDQGEGPATLIFDEVDAGIGGEAAVAVGRALAALGADHQVLVVTHLPQVAAFADSQLVVSKDEVDGRTLAEVTSVDGGDRVVELSRMLSGSPDSETARRHAEELLERVHADGHAGRQGSRSRRVRLG